MDLDALVAEVHRSWVRDWELCFGEPPPADLATKNEDYAFYMVYSWTAANGEAAILDWLENAAAERFIVRGKTLSFGYGITDEEVKDVFDYHPWDSDQVAAGAKIREALGAAFKAVIENAPPSADRSTALRKIREARMDANSAITHGGKY